MSKSPVDGPGLAMVGIGSILVYAGIKGYSVLAVLGNLVTGKPIGTGVTVTNSLYTANGALPGGIAAPPVDPSNVAGSALGGNQAFLTGNQVIARPMLDAYGWNDAEWSALVNLWTKESSWNNHAKNASSGAYGIPQALPYTKMSKAAWPESAGGQSDAASQISWGLTYIRQRYGSPRMAWQFHQQNNWY